MIPPFSSVVLKGVSRSEVEALFTWMERGMLGKAFARQTRLLANGNLVALTIQKNGPVRIYNATLLLPQISSITLELILPWIEHGVIDWESADVYPTNGYVSGLTDELIANSQGEWRLLQHVVAGTHERQGDIRQYQVQAPSSCWSGDMARYVEAVYGTGRVDYITTAGPNNVITITNNPTMNLPMGCWWGGTAGLMILRNFRYLFLLVGTSDYVAVQGVLTPAGEAHRLALIDIWDSLSFAQKEIEQRALMGQLSPGPVDTYVTGELTGVVGAPLAYGWHWDPTTGNVVDPSTHPGGAVCQAVCIEVVDGAFTSWTHKVEFGATVTYEGNITDIVATVTSTKNQEEFAVSGTVSLMKLDTDGLLYRFGTTAGHGTIAVSEVPIYGAYHGADGIWVTEKYSGRAAFTGSQIVSDTRSYCTGTAAGSVSNYHNTYQGGGKLSSAGGWGDGSTTSAGQGITYTRASLEVTVPPGYAQPPTYGWTVGGVWWADDHCGDQWDAADGNTCSTYPVQNRVVEFRLEHLVSEPFISSVGASLWQAFIPSLGDCSAWYVGFWGYRPNSSRIRSPVNNSCSILFDWRKLIIGSNPPAYCATGTYERMQTISLRPDGESETLSTGGANTSRVSRVSLHGSGTVWEDSGIGTPVSSGSVPLVGSVSGLPDVDLTKEYAGSAWDQFVAADFITGYTPPQARASATGTTVLPNAGGVSTYEKEPGNGQFWPHEYVVGYTPTHTLWSFVGRPGEPNT